jgi:hypothetical protein
MDKYDRGRITTEETYLIAPCGIYCGACDMKLGRSRSMAREMYIILNGFNFADVGPFFMGIERERIIDFINILEQWSKRENCAGCLGGGGNPACPIKTCVNSLGFITCAECEHMPCKCGENNKNWFQDASAFLELITKRYGDWNIKNLERIRKVGYRQFIDEMQEEVKTGFLTSDVITDEMIFTEIFNEMLEQRETDEREETKQ